MPTMADRIRRLREEQAVEQMTPMQRRIHEFRRAQASPQAPEQEEQPARRGWSYDAVRRAGEDASRSEDARRARKDRMADPRAWQRDLERRAQRGEIKPLGAPDEWEGAPIGTSNLSSLAARDPRIRFNPLTGMPAAVASTAENIVNVFRPEERERVRIGRDQLAEAPVPDLDSPEGRLLDLRDAPLGAQYAASAVQGTPFLGGLLGGSRFAYTEADELNPGAMHLSRLPGQLGEAIGTGFAVAPKVAPLLGSKLPKTAPFFSRQVTSPFATGAVIGAGVASGTEVKITGGELDPQNITASALAGTAGGGLPVHNIGAVLGSLGFDVTIGAIEAVRRDPYTAEIVAKMADGQGITDDEKNHLAMSGVMMSAPSMAGTGAAWGAARAQRATMQQQAREAVRREAPRIRSRIADLFESERSGRDTMARYKDMSAEEKQRAYAENLRDWDEAFVDQQSKQFVEAGPEAEAGADFRSVLGEEPVTPRQEVSTDAQEVRSDPGQPEVTGQVRPEGEAGGRGDVQQGAQARPEAGDAQAQPAREVAPPPRQLANAKPRYGKQVPLFESELDKAAYILRNPKKTPSKNDELYMDYAKAALGTDEAGVRAHGKQVHATVKATAKTSGEDTFGIPRSRASVEAETQSTMGELFQGTRVGTIPDTVEAKTFEGNRATNRGPDSEQLRMAADDPNAPVPDLREGAPQPPQPRIRPAPIEEGPVYRRHEIIERLEQAMGTKILQGDRIDPAIAGRYRPAQGQASTREHGDLDTIAHEISHRTDDPSLVGNYGKDSRLGAGEVKAMDAELIPQFSAHGSPSRDLNVQRAEGAAEWIRAWMLNPAEAMRAAPVFGRRFETTVPAPVRRALRDYGDNARRYHQQSALSKMVPRDMVPEPPTSTLESIRQGLTHPVKTLTSWADAYDWAFWDRQTDGWKLWRRTLDLHGLRPSDLSPSENFQIINRLKKGLPDMLDDAVEYGLPTFDFTGRRAPGFRELYAAIVNPSGRADTVTDMGLGSGYMIGATVVQRVERFRANSAKIIARLQEKINTLSDQEKLARQALATARTPVERDQLQRRIYSLTAKRGALQAKINRQNQRVEYAAQRKLTGAGGGLESDEVVARQAIKELMEMPDSARRERIQEFTKIYKQMADAKVDFAKDHGLVTAKLAEDTKSSSNTYAAMNRFGKRLDNTAFQKFEGSTLDIRSPLISLMHNTKVVMQLGWRNQAIGNYVNMLRSDRKMYGPDFVDKSIFGAETHKGDPKATIYMNNGVKEYWRLPPEIKDVIDPGKPFRASALIKGEGYAAQKARLALDMSGNLVQILKRAAVTAPQFLMRQSFREPIWAKVQTGSRIRDYLGYAVAADDNPEIRKFKAAGGSQAPYGYKDPYVADDVKVYYGMQRAIMNSLIGDNSVVNVITNPGRSMKDAFKWWERNVVQRMETANRMMEWRRAFKEAEAKGYGPRDQALYAAAKARNLIDYGEMGAIGQYLNTFIPFFNAAMQGQRRTLQQMWRDPAGWWARHSLFVTLPTALEYSFNTMQGPEAMEAWRARPPVERTFFYSLYIAPNFWIRIPKPFEMALPTSMLERTVDSIVSNENQFKGTAGVMARSALPMNDPGYIMAGGFLPILETIMNHSIWQDRAIVPQFETGKDIRLRTTDRSSNLAQNLAGMYNGVASAATGKQQLDPRKVDYLIGSYFGGWGRMAQGLSDLPRKDRIRTSADWARTFTGLVGTTAGPDSVHVKEAFDLASAYGQMSNQGVRDLIELRNAYYQTASREDRERLAGMMVQQAKSVSETLKTMGPAIIEQGVAKSQAEREARANAPR